MKNSVAFILVFISAFIAAFGQILLKLGVNSFSEIISFASLLIILGLLCYFIAAVLLIMSLKRGELSVLYPIYSLSFVWVAVLSIFFLSETMNLFKWFGILLILGGVIMVTRGRKK